MVVLYCTGGIYTDTKDEKTSPIRRERVQQYRVNDLTKNISTSASCHLYLVVPLIVLDTGRELYSGESRQRLHRVTFYPFSISIVETLRDNEEHSFFSASRGDNFWTRAEKDYGRVTIGNTQTLDTLRFLS